VEGPKNRWQCVISLSLSIYLSGHLTYAVVACSLTASSHQIHAARVSGCTLRKCIWLEQGWANCGPQAVCGPHGSHTHIHTSVNISSLCSTNFID